MKLANNRMPFTQYSIDSIPYEPKGKQKTYYDSNPTHLTLIVGEFTKTFYLQARVRGSGSFVKVKLGKYGAIKLSEAKELVVEARVKLSAGINPNLEKKKSKEQAGLDKVIAEKEEQISKETVEFLLDEYRDEHIIRVKGGSESSINDINGSKFYFKARTITLLKEVEITKGKQIEKVWTIDRNEDLDDWLGRPYRSITKREILDRFKLFSISLSTNATGVIKPMVRSHQKAFKNLSAAYGWVIPRNHAFTDENENGLADGLIENPVEIISVYKLWTTSKPRESYIDFYNPETYKWWKAVDEYRYEGMLARDYIFVSILQGGRSNEVAPLEWKDVDMRGKSIIYRNTKNDNDYTIPMTKFVHEIFERRFNERSENAKYVFEFAGSKHGYVVKSARHYFEKVAEVSGIKITHHDFRRTIMNISLEEEMNIPAVVLDYILKHHVKGVDKHYFIMNKRIILNAMQKIEDAMFKQIEKFKKLEEQK
jgi:integrase